MLGRRQAGAGARGSASTVNEAMVMCDVLGETRMGLGGQGE